MSRTMEQCQRLAVEAKLLAKYMPNFRFYEPRGNTYVEGWARTQGGKAFKLKVVLPPDYPYAKPRLYVLDPVQLPRYGARGTVNDVGISHSFHTFDNGPDGCVQICHTRDWDASLTLLKVLLKGVVWLEAYSAHLRTGRDIADYLRAA